jgi:hypothetical protein
LRTACAITALLPACDCIVIPGYINWPQLMAAQEIPMATLLATDSRSMALRAGMATTIGLPPEATSRRAVRWLDSVRPVPPLRDWLAGQWGLIFSHPEDFQESGLELEQDRWLVVLAQEFRAAGLRPLSCPTINGSCNSRAKWRIWPLANCAPNSACSIHASCWSSMSGCGVGACCPIAPAVAVCHLLI